jgi:nucleotide-binding universal stress UspA family protein
MFVKCPVCGGHVLRESAVEIEVGDEIHRYCSAACSESDEAQAVTGTALPALPALPRRIVVAVDGSGPSLRGVEYAAAWAAASGGEVHAVHSVEHGWLRTLGVESAAEAALRLGVRSDKLAAAFADRGTAHLGRCQRICEKAGVPFSSQLELRAPLEALVAASREADLVVIGSRGLHALAGTVLGSLSQRLISACHAPVLVIH